MFESTVIYCDVVDKQRHPCRVAAVILPNENILLYKNNVFAMNIKDGEKVNLFKFKKNGYAFTVCECYSSHKVCERDEAVLKANTLVTHICSSRYRPTRMLYPNRILYLELYVSKEAETICESYMAVGQNFLTILRFNGNFNTVLHCGVRMGDQIISGFIMPRSELLVFNNRMYSIVDVDDDYTHYDPDEVFSFEPCFNYKFYDLINTANEGHTIFVHILSSHGYHFGQRRYMMNAAFGIRTSKDNYIYKYCIQYHVFSNIHDRTCSPMFDNEKVFKVRRIQRFLRARYNNWRNERRLALAMALHPVLGCNSLVAMLSTELVARLI